MNGNHERSLAVVENKTDSNAEAIEKLTSIVHELATTVGQLGASVQLIQQSQSNYQANFNIMRTDVSNLNEKSNMLRGGWIALSIIGAAIVGLAAVAGALATVLALRK